MLQRLTRCCLALITLPLLSVTADDEYPVSTSRGKVKVFILAGQSNMEGRGFPEPLTWQVSQKKYRERYTHFIRNGDYEAFLKKASASPDSKERKAAPAYLWSVRHDVWINYLEKHGDLTVGYGSPREGFGPEYNFGHVMGNHYDEQVLIIKTAWGGRALARGFLPPSSMLSAAEYARLAAEQNEKTTAWNKAEPARIEEYNRKTTAQNKTADRKRPLRKFQPRPIVTPGEYRSQFGTDYRNMVSEVHGCLAELSQRFPGYKGQGYEIQGFVWFQGWNDQYQDRWLTYEQNMVNFIHDVRKEFKAPGMPFVIGQMGHDGMQQDQDGSPRDYIKTAQAAVPERPEFKNNTLCIRTDRYWDTEAHAIYTGPGGWSRDVNKWRQFGNDFPYHYYGSPWCFAQIGTAFGKGMLTLVK